MKISILTSDFSNNSFGRTWLLAKLLQNNFEIEVIGPAFGNGIWKPLKDECDFPIKLVKGYHNGRFELLKLLKLISGDVIYACKPQMSSFGVGIIKKIQIRQPLVLDIDDWELGFGKNFYDSLSWSKKIIDFFLSITDWRSYYYKIFIDKLIRFSNAITVSGETLKKIFGGTVIHHGRDTDYFNPQRYDKFELKKKYLPITTLNKFIISFIGTARSHKGIEDLIQALIKLDNINMSLMIVGIDGDSYSAYLKKIIMDSKIQSNTYLFPHQPFQSLPEFLSFTDLVVIPQRETAFSSKQVPAKLFDAMAMAKPIISTRISDIPNILNNCGWIIEPGNYIQLTETIKYVYEHPHEAEIKGMMAREKCEKEYSWKSIEIKLANVFKEFLDDHLIG